MLNSEYHIFQACRAAATAWVMLSCTFFTEHIGQEAVLWRQFGYSFGEGNVQVIIKFWAAQHYCFANTIDIQRTGRR